MVRALVTVVVLAAASCCLAVAQSEDGRGAMDGWRALWTREPDVGQASVDAQIRREGNPAICIEHSGQKDWSLERQSRIAVQPGDIYEFSVWVRVQGAGEVSLGAAIYDAAGKAINWQAGVQSTGQTTQWWHLQSRLVMPPGVAMMHPRLMGSGPAKIWVDAFALRKLGRIDTIRDPGLPETMAVENAAIRVSLNTRDATITVMDRRVNRTWTQKPAHADLVLKSARAGQALSMTFCHVPTGRDIEAMLQVEADRPEFVLSLRSDGELPGVLAWPHPFVSGKDTYLVVPMNEGISYPADDMSIEPMRLIAYGGHGICMAFWGVTDGHNGQMTIIETPDDCAVRIGRSDGRLHIGPEWESQKGRWGYERRLRYIFFDSGGHVAMCKRYRAYARKIGLLKTFEQKRRENPNIDLLIGAANIWCFEKDALGMVKELREADIERILWSNRANPETIRAMNQMGILTSRYDIYQDVMDPANFPMLNGVHQDWTTAAWPKDLMRDRRGDWIRGWRVRGNDGRMYPCGVLCDRQALTYADQRIAAELTTHPYRSRFIDTTTASPWRECYDPAHPVTRSESRQYKMELLRLVSGKYHLVCGCETGHDAAVPYVDYFEGMLSLGSYRVPDSGRDIRRIWDAVPENVAKFQVGQKYRLPLWELVYHDCVVAQWYWGDYNNKLPSIWNKRDLFNVLYGTPPMYMFDRELWRKHRDRFVQSYRDTSAVARATGYSEMTDHCFLTADRTVQQTSFANGVKVMVNFGDAPHRLADGSAIPAEAFRVTGMMDAR